MERECSFPVGFCGGDDTDHYFIISLKLPEKVANWYFDCLRNSHQGVHRNVFLRPLNLSNIFWIEVGEFGEFFLSKSGFSPVLADGIAKQPAMSLSVRHRLPD